MVVNEFRGFDEGPQLLDLYFGGNRPSLLANAAIVALFYASSLLGALFFLRPRQSRLRIIAEIPVFPLSSFSARPEEDLSLASGGGGDVGGRGTGMVLTKNDRDPGLLEVLDGDGGAAGVGGPLYYLEEKAVSFLEE